MSRIRLTWNNASTTIVEQRVYRSTSPLDVDDMPEPLAVLPRRDREYLDSAIVDGLTYCYAVSSVLPDYSELISEEIEVEAVEEADPYWDMVVFYAPFTNDMLDSSIRSIPTDVVGGCYIDSSDGAAGSGCLVAPSMSYVTAEVDAKFEDKDFTIECFVKSNSTLPAFAGLASFEGLLGFDHPLMSATITGTSLGQGSIWVSSNGFSWNVLSNAPFAPLNDGGWHHLACTRSGSSLRVFLDGQLKHTALVSGVLPQKGPMSTFGKKLDGLTQTNTVKVQHVRITKGVARYTENFTPPTKAFPNN